jgi:hypothetical protein
MATEDRSALPQPFDEQAALDNLARLQRELEESRQRRKDASAAFDSFVSSFRKPGPTSAAAPRLEPRNVSPRLDQPLFPPSGRRRTRALPGAGLLAGGLVAIAAGVLVTRAWRGSATEDPQPLATAAVSSPAASATTPGAQDAARASAQSTPASTAPAELLAVRRVWVRVTADGQRVAEREIEAGTRIPLKGRTIVVRAGDAGAIRLWMQGQDRGPLGPDGIVATRTYTIAAPTGR